jgi:sodium-dependent dicarboxylate transporter 2/3/5
MRHMSWDGRRIGLVAGPALFLLTLLLPSPEGMRPEAQRAAAVVVWMATWWMSEAVPLAATALLPLVLFPLLRVVEMKEAAAPYADPTIFLFMGGFFLAAAMERWGLHRRIALNVVHRLGLSPSRIVLGFMVATAFISLWISNTATTVMMLPIALAVARQVAGDPGAGDSGAPAEKLPEGGREFGMVLMLSVAYAASIGGIGTLIGTPPNLVFAGVFREMFPDLGEVTFVRWLAFGMPMVLLYLPLSWWYLTRRAAPLHRRILPGSRAVVLEQLRALEAMNRGEKVTLATLGAATLLWVFRVDIDLNGWVIPGWGPALGVEPWVNDATVAVAAALFLFCVPLRPSRREFALDWTSARRIPWDILLLFGGGFAMANGVHRAGLADWVGGTLRGIAGWPPLLMIALVAVSVTLLSEFASNTAIATTFMPILGATAQGAGLHPFVLMAPAAMAATLGFMLPVSTPPNAIVFGTGYIRVPEMVRAGIWMDLAGAALVALIVRYISLPLLGIPL